MHGKLEKHRNYPVHMHCTFEVCECHGCFFNMIMVLHTSLVDLKLKIKISLECVISIIFTVPHIISYAVQCKAAM